MIAADLCEGDSVAVNGCCLTATTIRNGSLTFDLLEETLARTNLGTLLPEDRPVNLERALAAGGRLGGHFVQGHIDATVRVLSSVARGADHRIEVELPAGFTRLRREPGFGRAKWRQPNNRGSASGKLRRLDYSAHAPANRISKAFSLTTS